MRNFNGFIFNDIGDLIGKPDKYSDVDLITTRDQLHRIGDHISALLNENYFNGGKDMGSKFYVVKWDIELEATSAEDAARKAREWIEDRAASCHVFNVIPEGRPDLEVSIDLDALDD